jgi:tetratricopeptide (TPR) repeat protein
VGKLKWDVRVARSPEPEAHAIVLATRALDAGDRPAAEQGYRDVQRRGLLHSVSWSNLAALAIGLGDATGARAHAQRALQLDRGNADAWVNFGVASWQLGQRRDAAEAMRRALGLDRRNDAAALNFARMQQAGERFDRAREILDAASQSNPRNLRLTRALAEIARLQMDHAAARTSALRALALIQFDPGQPGTGGLRPPAGSDVKAALVATCDRLQAVGADHHLMAGTLLAIVKDGRLFPHDKDVDLALPDLDPAALAGLREAMLADGAFSAFPPAPALAGSEITVVGLLHVASGVGVDLMLPRRQHDGGMRNETGWPDQLVSVLSPYAIGRLHWEGRDWPVPDPLEPYLAGMYGADWREQVSNHAGVAYDRCYSDTMLSNASRTPESIPRAVTLGLLRLLEALDARAWSKAVAYCAQLLAREELAEVRRVLARLQAAGHDGLRADG